MLYLFSSHYHLTDLKLGLKDFGLNPTEWVVLQEEPQTYKVRSKTDKNFMFQGKACRRGKKLKWEKLELISF